MLDETTLEPSVDNIKTKILFPCFLYFEKEICQYKRIKCFNKSANTQEYLITYNLHQLKILSQMKLQVYLYNFRQLLGEFQIFSLTLARFVWVRCL